MIKLKNFLIIIYQNMFPYTYDRKESQGSKQYRHQQEHQRAPQYKTPGPHGHGDGLGSRISW